MLSDDNAFQFHAIYNPAKYGRRCFDH